MPWWLDVLIGVAAALVLSWLVLLVALARARPATGALRESVRLLPDTLRLIGSLARDRTLPRGVRVRLWLLLCYIASPVDIVPDFIPVLGFADDVVVIGWGLRSVIRRAGRDAVTRHWHGTDAGLRALLTLVGHRGADAGSG